MSMLHFLMQIFRRTWLYDELRLIRDSIVTFRKLSLKGSITLFMKVRSCHRKYGWEPDEYFLYKYESLSDGERQSFVSEKEHVTFSEKVNPKGVREILSDKWKTYEAYREYFGREACLVTINNNGGV